jgi:hypothetical protein
VIIVLGVHLHGRTGRSDVLQMWHDVITHGSESLGCTSE